ncbi:actin-like protein arp8 [Mycoemilia scoparia]|uniref:Actin-like protein arp8 n=1 Tax=Mycoemilia scoparia TaxID=417184 RepID=A0A9W8A5T6_9FUNG|nr:actin-like protein arp8 [Mycoemilia scoparia]
MSGSGFSRKKKYSWLPESNPAAISSVVSNSSKSTNSTETFATNTPNLPPKSNIDTQPQPTKPQRDSMDYIPTTASSSSGRRRRGSDTLHGPGGGGGGNNKDSIDELVRAKFLESKTGNSGVPGGGAHMTPLGGPMNSVAAQVQANIQSSRHQNRRKSSQASHDGSSSHQRHFSSSRHHGRHPSYGHENGGQKNLPEPHHGAYSSTVGHPSQYHDDQYSQHNMEPANSQQSQNVIYVPSSANREDEIREALPTPAVTGSVESKYSFPTIGSLNPRNVTSTFMKGDKINTITSLNQDIADTSSGENVIVIQPGSRWLRIGLASDPMPKQIPHVIARKRNIEVNDKDSALLTQSNKKDNHGNQPKEKVDGESMDIEEPERGQVGDSENDDRSSTDKNSNEEVIKETVTQLRALLRQQQRDSKRKPVPNAHAQVTSFNQSCQREEIHDHNDPFKVDWTGIEGEYESGSGGSKGHQNDDDVVVVGERAINVADPAKYIVRYPMQYGFANIGDYQSLEEILGDLQTIWTEVLRIELGVESKDISKYYAVLVIPEIPNKLWVRSLMRVVLNQMGFGAVLIQHNTVLATFGAGTSSACVVDVGAQKTTIACVDDGMCNIDTVVHIKYGGDDITRFFADLLLRSKFPYREIDLARAYDWELINGLKERHCNLDLSQINVRVYSFFVRAPYKQTQKYSIKVYDEVYMAPLCLFYPQVLPAYNQLPDFKDSFMVTEELIHEQNTSVLTDIISRDSYGDSGSPYNFGGFITPTQFCVLPRRKVQISGHKPQTETRDGSKDTTSTMAAETSPNTEKQGGVNKQHVIASSAPITPPSADNGGDSTNSIGSGEPAGDSEPQSDVAGTTKAPGGGSKLSHPKPIKLVAMTTPSTPSGGHNHHQQHQLITTQSDVDSQYSLMPLDKAITHSISMAGGEDKAKRLYGSILMAGGGFSLVPGFEEVLQMRLYNCRPEEYQGIERIHILPAPRDIDPRVMAWKGGAVLGRLEAARDMWIKPNEWNQYGTKTFKERLLFQW